VTNDGEHIPPIKGDRPCDEYDESGVGAGLEADAMPQCATCGHPWSAHIWRTAESPLPAPGVDPAVDELSERWYALIQQVAPKLCAMCRNWQDEGFANADYTVAAPNAEGVWEHASGLRDEPDPVRCEASDVLRAISKLFHDALCTVPSGEVT
jgi:hypothetical protein